MIDEDVLVSVVTPAGEFVGKLSYQSDTKVTLKNPRMIVQTPDGGMGFAHGVCLTGKESPEEVTFWGAGIVLVTESNDRQISQTTNFKQFPCLLMQIPDSRARNPALGVQAELEVNNCRHQHTQTTKTTQPQIYSRSYRNSPYFSWLSKQFRL